jgi:uncharacterized protein (DUF2267 family)
MSLNFNQFAAEANTFLKLYTKELNLGNDTEQGGRILSSILHGLREVISVEESLQLIAQFPMFLKAVYVNGWSSRKKKRIKSMTDFIDLVREFNGKTSLYDFESDEIAENYIKSTFMVLRKHISLGELEDIRTELPKDLKSMVYQNIMF